MDLSKAATLSTSAVSSLWTSYHQTKGFLSAVIPSETYERMSGVAKKYPIFVLPLAREIFGEDIPEGSPGAVEMHLLVRRRSPCRAAKRLLTAFLQPKTGMGLPPRPLDGSRARSRPLNSPVHPPRRVPSPPILRPTLPHPHALHRPLALARHRPHAG